MTDPVAVTKPPLVLLHGVGLDRTMWSAFRALTRRPTIAYDLLGLGDAPKPPGRYRLADYVEQFSDEMDRASLRGPVDVAGFSMGALIAQGIAVAHPERVRRLVLVNAVFNRTAAERAAIVDRVAEVRAGSYLSTIEPAIERWFTPSFAATHPAVVDAVRQRMLTNDVQPYASAYEVFATADAQLVDQTGRITAPTLVVTGADDQRSTPAMTTALAGALADGRAVIVPGVRHLLPLEAPDTLARLIDDFLSDTPTFLTDAPTFLTDTPTFVSDTPIERPHV